MAGFVVKLLRCLWKDLGQSRMSVRAMVTHRYNALLRFFSVSFLGIARLWERNALFHPLYFSCPGIARSSEPDAWADKWLSGLMQEHLLFADNALLGLV